MSKYKNTLLIFLALVLFAYAGFISVFPAFLTKTFNIDEFEQKIYDATSIVTTIDDIEYKILPNFKTIIILRNWSSKYIDEQPLFGARYIEIETTPMSLFTKNFNIKSMYLKNIVYKDQILPDGTNKIAFLPEAFNSELFGAKKITIVPGPVRVKNFKIVYIGPKSYKEQSYREKTYDKSEVKDFLSSFTFSHVEIK